MPEARALYSTDTFLAERSVGGKDPYMDALHRSLFCLLCKWGVFFNHCTYVKEPSSLLSELLELFDCY